MDVHISLHGGFLVTVDGDQVPDHAWSRRQAAALVKLLALSPGHRLHREQVMEALWPGSAPDAAAPRLHKAAHYARRALGGDEREALVLRQELVLLLPDAEVTTDHDAFMRAARAALAAGSSPDAIAAAALYAGPLLPDDPYEPWTHEAREAARSAYLDLLRLAERWDEMLGEEPADEEAHLALAERYAAGGDVHRALRQLERLEQALRQELGTAPGPRVTELRRRLEARQPEPVGNRGPGTRLVGRRAIGDRVREQLSRAEDGHGSTLLVVGPAGVGKSAVLAMATALAERRDWRLARGTASAVEGPWPYAPVLEALRDLCRHHPALLDGLADDYRTEIERALGGGTAAWSGETSHQRLFVAAAELVRLAAAGNGLMLVVDDLHDADEASTRLLHYLARCALDDRVVLVLARRSGTGEGHLDEMQRSLVARGAGQVVDLAPLDEQATRRLLALSCPEVDDATAGRIWAVSGGLPFAVLELARGAEAGDVTVALPGPVRRTLQRAALLGETFSTDELVAVSGVADQEAFGHLDAAIGALVVHPAESGYRFRHALVREHLVAAMSPRERLTAHRAVAEALAGLGAPPGRVAHQFLAAGLPARAVPFVLPAVESAGALGAYRDALGLVDAVLDHASGPDLGHLLARRGDLLMAVGDPGSVAAYRAAMPVTSGTEHRLVRARLARGATFLGDFETARSALAGVDLEGDGADGPILLARGNFSYFTGDVDAAWEAASAARRMLLTVEDPWHYVDLVGLQGLIAHQRGEWFERFRMELRSARGNPGLMTALFDAHLCVAEYLLYGPIPYDEVIDLSEQLRRRAAHDGALRAVAFTTALIGEASLLRGDLERAERELEEAVDLHKDVDASAGEAHSLQRLAEVRLAQGRNDEAQRLLQRALPLARWSVISMHLLQRIYGTMITAAPHPALARAVVDRAHATVGAIDACPLCDVMLAVPAAIACARTGDLPEAHRQLAIAERSAARWEGSAWPAALLEARAHVALAEHDERGFVRMLGEAAELFTQAGQPLDAVRCASARDHVAPASLRPAATNV